MGRIIFLSPWICETKGQKAARKWPEIFAAAKLGFYQRIKEEIETWSIPLALINWDQTGSKIVPVGELTMEREGARHMVVVGKKDKREITVLLSVAANRVDYAGVYRQGSCTLCYPDKAKT